MVELLPASTVLTCLLLKSSTFGVPQGSVLSPSLFNFFTSDFPLPPSKASAFALNFFVRKSSPSIDTLTNALNENLKLIEKWADDKGLTIAPHKSSVVLSSLDLHQTKIHPQVFYKAELIPLDKKPKWLVNIVDTRITSSHHASDVDVRISRRLNIMNALSGSTFGQCKEPLLLTYKCLVCPLINFGIAIYYPNTSTTSIKELQITQNAGLRIAIGNHMKSPVEHLHAECNILTVLKAF
jgi:hypothetical protein